MSEFHCSERGYLQTCCRACNNAASRRWAAENPERHSENCKRFRANNPRACAQYSARWAKDNPLYTKAKSLVDKAGRKGGTDIDVEWVMKRLESGVCELSGVSFVYSFRHPCLPSIDRIDPTQPGHMKDNCRVILWGLNAFKGTASEKVFLESLEKVSAAFVQG